MRWHPPSADLTSAGNSRFHKNHLIGRAIGLVRKRCSRQERFRQGLEVRRVSECVQQKRNGTREVQERQQAGAKWQSDSTPPRQR